MIPNRSILSVRILSAVIGFLFCFLPGDARPAEDGKADVVLRNGKIYTADPARSIRQAMAFTGNNIIAVGNNDEVEPLIGPSTKVIDLGGKLVLPGLIDTHTHPITDDAKCSLDGVEPTLEALKGKVQACLKQQPGGADDWLEAVQLDNYGFQATSRDLDEIEKTRPIALKGNDGHAVWVNSRGLALLDLADTSDPNCGEIVRDTSGAPTGAFIDDAVEFVAEKLPPSPVEKRAALTAAELSKMSAHGITSLMDALVTPAEKDVWQQLYRTGRLHMRVRMAIAVDDPNDASDQTVKQLVEASKDIDPNFLRSGVVKVFADGVMEYPAQTAALLAPYLDAHGNPTNKLGNLCFKPERFGRLVEKLDAAGIALHIHAVGDRAVRESLNAFATARKVNGAKDNRHQIAHLQLIDPEDIPRFKELGVIADMQLLWAQREEATEKDLAPYLGPERHRRLYPAGSLHAAGAMIIGGSDWDVTSHNPFLALQVAVTRTGGKGQDPLNVDERVPLATAVDAYTINAAFAMKQDAITGSLEVGKRADLIVLDRDIFSVDPDTIGDTKVLATYLDGRLVYTASATGRSGVLQ